MKPSILILIFLLSACSTKHVTKQMNKKHLMVNAFEDCDTIEADTAKLGSNSNGEKVYWNANRKLTIADFKGATANRPFQAATFSGIEYFISPISSKDGFDVRVQTRFDCSKSYFIPSTSNAAVLAHEQLHFDIIEIYARLFLKRLAKAHLNPYNFSYLANIILKDINTDLSLKQAEYDAEVYGKHVKQSKWDSWAQTELERLKAYSEKEIEIKRS